MSWLLRIDKALEGQPDRVLAAMLLAAAAVAVAVALWAPPSVKALVAAWYLLP